MKHDVRKYLTDVLEAIELIRIHVAGINDLTAYKANVTVKDAVVRRLTIIGEALYQTRKQDRNIAINHKENIIGLRHILVHDYDIVEDKLIWSIVTTYLDPLYIEVEKFLTGEIQTDQSTEISND